MHLFKELFIKTNLFLKLGKEATTKQSKYGILHNQPTTIDKKKWLSLVVDIEKNYTQLQAEVHHGIKNNKTTINAHLSLFRSIARRIDSNNYYWSAFHEDIDNVLDEIITLISEIDQEYGLGWQSPEILKKAPPSDTENN